MHVLSVTLIHFFGKDVGSKLGSNPGAYGSPNTCQLCHVEDHTIGACPVHTYMQQKCAKCGGGQRVGNCGFGCPFYNGFGHAEDICRKKRDSKGLISVANYSEMLVNNEETTLAKLN